MAFGGLKKWLEDRAKNVGSVASRTYDQVNPFDSGRSFTTRTPAPAPRKVDQEQQSFNRWTQDYRSGKIDNNRYNSLLKMLGREEKATQKTDPSQFYNPLTKVTTAIAKPFWETGDYLKSSAQVGAGNLTRNQAAADNARLNRDESFQQSLIQPVSQTVNTFDPGARARRASLEKMATEADTKITQASQAIAKEIQAGINSGIYDPVKGRQAIMEILAVGQQSGALAQNIQDQNLAQVGLDRNMSKLQTGAKVYGNALNTASLVVNPVSARALAGLPPQQARNIVAREILTNGTLNSAGMGLEAYGSGASLGDSLNAAGTGFLMSAGMMGAGYAYPAAKGAAGKATQPVKNAVQARNAQKAFQKAAQNLTPEDRAIYEGIYRMHSNPNKVPVQEQNFLLAAARKLDQKYGIDSVVSGSRADFKRRIESLIDESMKPQKPSLLKHEGGYIRLSDGKDITPSAKRSADDYGISHRPNKDYSSPGYDLSDKGNFVPEDIYDHPEWYGNFHGEYGKASTESMNSLRKIRNNPDAEITIYRTNNTDELNAGDWVTPSKKYAEMHLASSGEVGDKVHAFKVKAKELRWPGDDLNEFGFFPETTKPSLKDKLTAPFKDEMGAVGRNIRDEGLNQPTSKQSGKPALRVRPPQEAQSLPATIRSSQASQGVTLRQAETAQTGQSQGRQLRRLAQTYPDNTTNIVNKRGFTQSVKRSGEVSPDTQKAVSGEYNVRSTAKLAVSADTYAKGNLNRVTKEVNSRLDVPTGKINDQDIADSIAVAKRLDAKGDFEQATQIYDKLAEHGTKGGQAIQAFSLLRNRTPDGMKFQAIKQLKKAGVKLTDTEQKELSTLIEGVKKTKPGSEARDRAIYNTLDYVTRKIPTSRADKIVNFWRAGLLTAPRTTGGNILGNTTEALTREFWTNPVAASVDKFFSLFTGKRTKVFRTGGRTSGFVEGTKKGADYLKTGFDTRDVNFKYDAPRRVNYKNKVVDTYVNGVYRLMGGQDQPFYYAAKSAAARDLAKADGINLGYKGKQLAEYVEKSVFDENWKPQTFKTAKDATDYAKYAVYQNDTMLGAMAAGLKRSAGQKSKSGRAIADFVLPFTQVPSSVAMRIIDRTPVGIVREVVNQIVNKSFDQRAMAEAIANGTFGIGIFAVGKGLAESGLITGAYPKDSKERKLWESEGKQPYSVKVGDRWYSLNYMQPFGTILSMGKQFSDDIKGGKSESEAWLNSTAAAAQSVENQSFLQGLNGLLSAINDPNRSMKQYANSTAGGVIPNFIRAGATAIDPKQREIDSPIQAVQAGVPGLRQNLNTKLDMFGNDLPARDNALNQYLNPFRPSKVREGDPVVGELRRLQDADEGIVTTEFNKKSIGGVDLNDSQVRDLNQRVNNSVHAMWGQMVKTPEYQNLSDSDKRRALEKAKEQIATNAKAQFVSDYRINSTTEYKEKAVDINKILSSSGGNTVKTIQEKYDSLKADLADPNNGWSDVKKSEKQRELKKLEIQKNYDEDTVDLYGWSKERIKNYIENNPDGKALYDKLVAYDNALYDAGLIGSKKLKYGLGSGKGGRGGSKTALKTAISTASSAGTAKPIVKVASGSAPSGKLSVPAIRTANRAKAKTFRTQAKKIAKVV